MGARLHYAQTLQHDGSIHVRHSEVEQDGVGIAARGFANAVFAGGRFKHLIVVMLEKDTQQAADLDFVLDQQHGRFLAVKSITALFRANEKFCPVAGGL